MRLCLIATSYSRFDDDGNARFVRSIAEAQAALGHEVHVLAPYSPQVKPYASPVHVHWFKYVWPSRRGVMGHAAALENDRRLRGAALWQAPLFAASLLWHLQQLINRHHFDLLHAHWVIPSGVLVDWAARVNRLPFFISLHGSDVYLAQHSRVWRNLARAAFRRTQGVTACSQPLADGAIRCGAQADRVRVIPYGADPARFVPAPDRTELRRRLNLVQDDLIVLGVGRLVGKKGFGHLVKAMPVVLRAEPRARLLILGDGPEHRLLEQLSRELGIADRVSLPGAVHWSEAAQYMAAADLFVMPSVRDVTGNLDGLPNVILEAMAAGAPIIATRIAGIPLAVRDHETGLLVDQPESDELSDAIVNLLAAPEKRVAMGREARARIETELNWREFARQLDDLYQAKS
jgi:glycosyltransferase involved in cell wall biosynthesis